MALRLAVPVLAAVLGGGAAVANCLHERPPRAATAVNVSASADPARVRSQGEFGIVFAGPKGTAVSTDEAGVSVVFNRPMRAIEAPAEAHLAALSVTTAAGRQVAGKARWVGTHGLLFVPDEPFAAGSRFEVAVPAGTRSMEGEQLAKDYRFSFSTVRPEVTAITPPEGTAEVRPDATVRVTFNQRVDPAVGAQHGRFVVAPRPGQAAKIIGARAVPAREGSADLLRRTLVFTPETPLPLDSAFDLVLDAGLTGEGELASGSARSFSMRTYGPLRLEDYRCAKVTLGRCQAHRDITLVFSTPVAPAEVRAHLKTPGLLRRPAQATAKTPPSKGDKDARPTPPRPSAEFVLGADPTEGKRYHVILTAGMRDVFGQTLAKEVAFDVDVEAPFLSASGKRVRPGADSASEQATPEEADEGQGSSEGEASAPPDPSDPRPRRPELRYSAELGIRGHVLEAKAKSGIKRHQVPVGTVNVPSYRTFTASLGEDDAVLWLGGGGLRGSSLRYRWASPGARENVRAVEELDLDAVLGGKDPRGAALLLLGVPGQGDVGRELVSVTDLGVAAKLSRYGSMVWVTRLSDGHPVGGADVVVRASRAKPKGADREKAVAAGDVLFKTLTDARGIAFVPSERVRAVDERGRLDPDLYLVVRSGDDWTYQRVERASASERHGGDVDLAQKGEWAGLLFADRGVYRPGETVKLSGIVRRADAAALKIVEGQDVRLEVKDAMGESVFSGRSRLDAFGEFAVDVSLPKSTHLGEAPIRAELGREAGANLSTSVLLAAYKASEFKVAVEPRRPSAVRGEAAVFGVQADYLYGAPLTGVNVHNEVTRVEASFSPPGSTGFVTADEAYPRRAEADPRAEELATEDGELDDAGHLEREVHLGLPRQRGPERVTFEAEVEDLTRQTVAARATVLVHPAAFYLGLRSYKERFFAVGADVAPTVAAFEPSGKRLAGVPVQIELTRRYWTEALQDDPGATAHPVFAEKEEQVGTCTLRTIAGVAACSLRASAPGLHILRASARDAHGNWSRASLDFYVVDDRTDRPAVFAQPEGRGLSLERDRARYEDGDKAKILIKNPFREADALVTVERAGVLWHDVVHVRGPMPTVEVPVRADYFPNAFVGVHLVRGRVQEPPERGSDVGAPDFRIGYTSIEVNPDTHRLKVDIRTPKQEYRPGEDLDADVLITGPDGRPARSELVFYAVDEGVLMLTAYRTPDPLVPFLQSRKLAVVALDSREHLAQILPMRAGEKVPRLGWEYLARATSNTSDDKGNPGGGGDDGGPRRDFKTTAYFEAGRVAAEGKAHVHFRLPDNLTSFRLMAVAASSDERFGFGESTITTSRRLMARPALPRSLRVGDAIEAGVVVASKGLGRTVVDVRAKVDGMTLSGPAYRRVEVAADGKVEVRFAMKAERPGKAKLEFTVAGGGESDRVQVERDVDVPVANATLAAYGEVKGAAAVDLGSLRAMRPDRGGLHVRVSSSALVGVEGGFEQLFEYPYGCTEQVTSRLLPMLAATDLAKAFGARIPATAEHLVDDAIGILGERQRGSGGFGFWEDDPEEAWLSAYAMLGLEVAAKHDYFVPKAAREQGIAYLRGAMNRLHWQEPTDKASDKASSDEDSEAYGGDERALAPEQKRAWDYAVAALAADTLATAGEPDPGYLHQLFDARPRMPLFARAFLLHAMALARMPASERDVLANELVAEVRQDAGEAMATDHDEHLLAMLDSEVRTTALILRALVAHVPKHPLAPRLARGIMNHRTGAAWRSTQETAWVLLALEDYWRAEEGHASELAARVFLGDTKLVDWQLRGSPTVREELFVEAKDLAGRPDARLVVEAGGQGTVFFSADLEYATTELPPRAVDRGLFVHKLVRGIRPEEFDAARRAIPSVSDARVRLGSLVLVDLLFESAEPREQVVLDDPLVSGFEPVDAALDTASVARETSERDARQERPAGAGTYLAKEVKTKGVRRGGYGFAFQQPAAMHREYRDDRVLTFLPHVEPGIYHFRYLARATTAGTFVAPPTEATCMYQPEVSGHTASGVVTIAAEGK